MESQNKTCQNCKTDFTIEPDDFLFYEKIKVPPPTWCPECRLIRRLVWRNERGFYKRKCDLCFKNIISFIPSDGKLKVYCHDCWWGDKWDAIEHGKDYDFSKPLIEQFKELIKNVPVVNLWAFNNINAEYANFTAYSKNIYLSNAVNSENIFYSGILERSRDCFDNYWVFDSELCYENFNTNKCFSSSFLSNCHECIDSRFLFDCRNCSNCFMCSNLRNKSFYINNKKYSKEDYFKELEKYNLSSYKLLEKIRNEFARLIEGSIHRFAEISNSINVNGDNIINSKDVYQGFMVENSENIKYCWRVTSGLKDSYDVSASLKNELVYESSLAGDNSSFVKFYSYSKNNRNSDLFYFCASSSYLFACAGLKSKQYCILNKQYTREQYEELIPKIIQHMSDMPYIDSKGRVYKYGEFFPSELSPFAYNETIAQEYFPLTKEEAIQQGYKWKDREERNYSIDIHTDDIPDSIKDIPDTDILNKVIECNHKGTCNQQCTEAFKIIPEELSFYRRMNLPLPRFCPNCRHYERLSQRNPMKLWHRACMKEGCTNTFETSYAPERPEIVYCERCYQQEVY